MKRPDAYAGKPWYQDPRVSIHNADSLELMPTLLSRSVDLVVTDPPYVIGAVSAGNLASKSGTWGDMMNSSRWFRDWYVMASHALKSTGAIWTFLNWRTLPVVMKAAADAGFPVASMLVWDKNWIGPGGQVGLRPSYELVALLPMEGFAIPNRGLPDVWTEQWASHKPSGHPAEKPERLLRRLIEASGLDAGSCVLDPFMGSGSTLRAAVDCGMRAIGIETEERWCVVARDRVAQLTLGDAA